MKKQFHTGPPARPGVQIYGRPKLGTYNLQTVLPQRVLDELLRAENETDVYRTRIAANVLCEWAKNKAAGRANSH
jgi:hypothetical protein